MLFLLGLVVAAGAVTIGVAMVTENTRPATLSVFGETIPGITAQWHVLLAGAAVAVLFMAGIMVSTLGVTRTVRIRRELRDLREEHEDSLSTLEMEKRQLERELARVRRDGGSVQVPHQRTGAPVPPQRTGGVKPSAVSTFFEAE